jgi:two-component system OmpR family sensor kinase
VVAREAVAEAAPLAVEHQLALDAPGELWVDGVPDDLHRAALNLIENALAHTPSGTPVTVSARGNDGFACLEVADRGPGVPAELRDRVFERFSRGGGDTGPPTGSGLGLAIVRAVAEAHGGYVTLDDAEGGGARFVLRVPLAHAPAAAPVEPAPR